MSRKESVTLLHEVDELRKLRNQADRRTADLIPALFHDMFRDEAVDASKALGEVCLKITDGVHITPTYVTDGVPFFGLPMCSRRRFLGTL